MENSKSLFFCKIRKATKKSVLELPILKPTYEQLETELAQATELLKLALEEIAELKEKLKLNSKNSSKPPSTDQKANTPPKSPKERDSRQGTTRPKFPPKRGQKRGQNGVRPNPVCQA